MLYPIGELRFERSTLDRRREADRCVARARVEIRYDQELLAGQALTRGKLRAAAARQQEAPPAPVLRQSIRVGEREQAPDVRAGRRGAALIRMLDLSAEQVRRAQSALASGGVDLRSGWRRPAAQHVDA